MKWLAKLFDKTPTPATVTATLHREPGDFFVLRIGGTLNKASIGHRKGEVRYFIPEDESKARAWLGG